MAYIIAFLALAAVPLALAAYGGHLAAVALENGARRRALKIVWTLAAVGVGLSGLQQYMSYRSDKARDADQARLMIQLGSIDNGVSELKHLTQANPNDPPAKVLAAAAKKILELDTKTRQLEGGVKDLTSVRRLNDRQKNILSEALLPLCSRKGGISVGLVWDKDSESASYANDFYQILGGTKCWNGYRSSIGEQFNPVVRPRGIILIAKDLNPPVNEATVLIDAFKKANIAYTLSLDNTSSHMAFILVGSKR